MTREDSQEPAFMKPGHELSRRALLKRAAAFGIAVPVVGGLLAACGSSSSSSSTSAASSSSSSSSTSTSSSSAAGTSGTSPASGSTTSQPGTASANGSGTPQAGAGSIKSTIEPAKHSGGKLIYGATSDAKTANPILSTDTSSGAIIAMMFEGMIRTDPTTADATSGLAKSWNISSDGITYSFVLNDGVNWHDGKPFTANDVKFTYDLMLNPDTKSVRYSTLKDRIDSIDVADNTHLSIKLKSPNAAFLVSNCGYGIIPQHLLQDVKPADLGQDPFSTGKKGRTIGTGPFLFEEWIKDDHVTVTKNPNYWRGAPHLDEWIYKVVPNQTSLTQQLKTSEIDFAAIQPPDVADMKKQSNVTVSVYDTFSFVYYYYNLDPAKTTLFQDKEVRQALFYAMDRKAMVQAIYFGLARVAVGTMPVLSWAYNPDGIKLKYPLDVDKAKSLLDSAGWKAGSDGIRAKNGKKLSFTIWGSSSSDTTTQMMTIFQQSWKAIGVDATPKTEEWNAFLNRINTQRDFEIALLGFSWGVDPDQTSMWSCAAYDGGFNNSKYCNPQVDKLLAEGLATTDHAKRTEIYTQMQNILMDDLPMIVPFFQKGTAGLNKRVHNMFPNAVSTLFNPWQWWVDA